MKDWVTAVFPGLSARASLKRRRLCAGADMDQRIPGPQRPGVIEAGPPSPVCRRTACYSQV